MPLELITPIDRAPYSQYHGTLWDLAVRNLKQIEQKQPNQYSIKGIRRPYLTW